MVLMELGFLDEINIIDLVKIKLKSLPESVMNHNDIKARLKQIRSNIKKITISETSIYDLTTKLRAQQIL